MVLKLGLHFFRPVTTLCVYPAIVNQMFLGNAKKIPVACTTGMKKIFSILFAALIGFLFRFILCVCSCRKYIPRNS